MTISFLRLRESRKQLEEILKCMGKPAKSHYITGTNARKEQFDIIQNYIRKNYPNVHGTCYVGYCGRQIEEYWYDEFHNKTIEEFGVFVPIIIKFTNFVYHQREHYYHFMNGLWNLISDDFLYVTLSGTDEGMEAGVDMDVPDNVFVLSSGGVGNVPLNLFLRDYEPIQVKENPKYTAVFMGRIGTHKIREEMDKICKETLGDRYFSGFSNEKKWTEIYSNSKAILCPRGNGRNSYRLTEVLQMGLIPIYVYNDIPWVPYYDSIEWEKFGFVTKIGDLAKVLKKIDKMNYTELTEMRNRVRSLSSTHFTVAGAMGQIAKFLKYGFHGTDLRCAERRVLKG